jgi:hypothetical protein
LTNTETTKSDGKLNFEMATTKAVTTKPQMEYEKKEKNLIKGKLCLKKENKGGEKTNSSEDKLVFVKKKAVQKTDSSNDDFEEIKLTHGNENEHIEEVMNQKGIKLSQLINQPLSDEDSNKINQIIKNKEEKPLDNYISYENESVSWDSMQILYLDTTEKVRARK